MLGQSIPSVGETPGLRPALDFGRGEVFGAMFEDTRNILPWMQTRRSREYFLEGKRGQSMRGVFERQMDIDELNDKYGIDGFLKFDVPMTEERAILQHEWKIQDMEREEILGRAGGFWNGVTKFGASIAASFADPIMLGAMFTPAVYARMTGAVGTGAVAMTTGQFAGRTLASELAINGITEAWSATMSAYGDKDYKWGDAAISTIFGTAFGVGTGMLGKMRYDHVMKGLSPQAKAEVIQSTLSDFIEGKATNKAEWRLRLDDSVLRKRAIGDVEGDLGLVGDDQFDWITSDGFIVNEAGEAMKVSDVTNKKVYMLGGADADAPGVMVDSIDDVLSAPSGSVISTTHIDVKNPAGPSQLDAVAKELGLDGVDQVNLMQNKDVLDALKAKGFDGVIIDNPKTGSRMYSVISKDQMYVPDTGDKAHQLGLVDDIRKRVDERTSSIRKEEIDSLTAEQRAQYDAQAASDELIGKPDDEVRRGKVSDSDELAEMDALILEQEESMGGLREGEAAGFKEAEAVKSAEEVEKIAHLSAIDCLIGRI